MDQVQRGRAGGGRMKKVLVACEESQTVCKAFRARGHEAYSCDIQDCSGGHPEWHIKGDVLPILNGSCEFTTMDGQDHRIGGKWDLIIAHPPCTYLSNAGACRMYKVIDGEQYIRSKRYWQMIEGRAFFQKMLEADCEHIAVENPLPLKIAQLPQPTQTIQPFEYGHPYSKRTLLWLKGLPPLFSTLLVADHKPWLPSNTSAYAKGSGGWKGSIRGSKNYAKTFEGIAEAMAEQWGDYIKKEDT